MRDHVLFSNVLLLVGGRRMFCRVRVRCMLSVSCIVVVAVITFGRYVLAHVGRNSYNEYGFITRALELSALSHCSKLWVSNQAIMFWHTRRKGGEGRGERGASPRRSRKNACAETRESTSTRNTHAHKRNTTARKFSGPGRLCD